MSDFYLSVVVAARNDNHGGDMLKRISSCVTNLIYQANRTKLKTELIIVEWNPPAGKPFLKEVLPAPATGDYLTIRYVIVPAEIHQRFFYASKMPLYQMIAKNVGIRRAKGKFVVCTNIDIIFSDECFNLFAEKKLDPKYFYRANRCDIPAEVMDLKSEQEKLKYAAENILKRYGNVYILRFVGWLPAFMFGFKNTVKLLNYIIGVLRKPVHGDEDFVLLDTHACGDFTMLTKEAWIEIQGYPEIDMYSIHIDSMGVFAALAAGYKQEIFPPKACIYHIFHLDGWDSHSNPIELLQFACERPCVDWNTVDAAARYLVENKLRWNLNKPTWGFSNENLQEFQVN